jgi:LacI family transcriptional regulator
MQPTQYDIARITGLSQATISRALRGDPAVTAETRARIVAACAELNYRPSMGARILAQGQRAIIGISLSRSALPTDRYVTILHQSLVAELGASAWGVRLLAADELEQGLSAVGAVILIGVDPHDARVNLCRQMGVPCVAIGYVEEPDVFAVIPDDDGGARMAVRHLHGLGRRTLAMMSSFNTTHGPAMSRRAAAAIDEAEGLGMRVVRIDTLTDVTQTLAGYRTIWRASGSIEGVDALFCDTDEHALGAWRALTDLGVDVPGQVSIVGFDDLPGLSRNLTTIAQDFPGLALTAISLAAEAQAGDPPRTATVPVTLKVRQS